MELTTFTDLSLRVVLQLAQAGGMAGNRLAAAVGAGEDELAPVLGRLRRLGLLTVRHDDRAELAPDSRGVSIGWLVRELEGTGEVVECGGSTPCPLARGCRLRAVLRRAQQEFFRALDPVTVDDIARGVTTSVEVLSIGGR